MKQVMNWQLWKGVSPGLMLSQAGQLCLCPPAVKKTGVRLSTLRNFPGSGIHEAARPLGKTYPGSAVLCSLEWPGLGLVAGKPGVERTGRLLVMRHSVSSLHISNTLREAKKYQGGIFIIVLERMGTGTPSLEKECLISTFFCSWEVADSIRVSTAIKLLVHTKIGPLLQFGFRIKLPPYWPG